ncbi:hypothetical protein RclHR1_07950001 [Rhizophagus clarus]|uniref:Uncharacterized protein n=1 Tax=Rhizophagus clarus TaxID=94130 RepID=A0A2Z6RZ54_9GLOM|nr:hypothetical protein RclHR1_07950001 [Rhizophagus clarus]
MERLCGMLLPLIKNNTKSYKNLVNNNSNIVFSIDDYVEELYWASTQYNLINTESNHLFKYYNGKNIRYVSTFDLDLYSKGFKYGRLRTTDGHYISSEWIKRQNSKTRNNYCIRRTVDRFANQHNKTPELIKSYIYVREENECKLFNQFSSKEFIDVRCIDHYVELHQRLLRPKLPPISASKSSPSDHFHNVIVDFISGLIKRNPESLFSSIITTDPSAIDEFLNTYKDQAVPQEKLRKYILTHHAKKKARKEKQKLQLQSPSGLDEYVVPTFSKESSEYTPSKPFGSRTVTFNQSLLSPPSTPYKQQLKRDSKPQSTPIDNGKKLKQKETDNVLKNGNVIITGYIPQDQEQAQLLDLVVYDILAKWDNYTLLANLG